MEEEISEGAITEKDEVRVQCREGKVWKEKLLFRKGQGTPLFASRS